MLGIVVVVLVGLFFGVGGWYFSGRIQSGALETTPSDGTPDYDLVVTDLQPGRVTIRAESDPPLALTQPSVYVLMWQGGSGHVGPAAGVAPDATEVTRPLSDVVGTPPTVGQPAALERDYYLGDPSAVGLDFSDVVVAGPLGAMPAWYVPATGRTWVVAVHGKGGLRREFLRTLPLVHEAGMPALVITYRNDLGNATDASGQYGYGATEWPDLQAAVEWATARGAERVVVYADSMGAAITAAFLQHSDRRDVVSAVVMDSPMLDLADAVALGASQTSLPVVGLPVPDSLVWVAERVTSLRYGVDFGALDYVSDPSWVRVPVLVLHGAQDPTAPIGTSERFAAAHPDLVRLERFETAAHLEAWNTERARYESVVGGFLRQHVTS